MWRKPRGDVSPSRQETPTPQQCQTAEQLQLRAASAASDPSPRCPVATGCTLGVVGRCADGDTAMVLDRSIGTLMLKLDQVLDQTLQTRHR
jgi:hypothetical protein